MKHTFGGAIKSSNDFETGIKSQLSKSTLIEEFFDSFCKV